MNYKIVHLQPGADFIAFNGSFFARLDFGGPSLATGVLDFTQARHWFEANFGVGFDLDEHRQWSLDGHPVWNGSSPKWAWISNWHRYHIYVPDGPTLGWFVLTHKYPVDQ